MLRGLLIVLGLASMAGCATPYQQMGLLGGVSAVRISEDTVQIAARGNAYTDADTIQRFALRRAAEETLADGFDLFRIDNSMDRTRVGQATSAYASGNRYGLWGTSYSAPIIKPGESLIIKMSKGPKPDPMPEGMYDAHELVKYLSEAGAGADHRNCTPGPDGKIVCL